MTTRSESKRGENGFETITSIQTLPDATRLGHRPVANNGRSFSFPRLSDYQLKETARRRQILQTFDALLKKGMSKAAASRELRVAPVNLWRWRQRIAPLTHLCGRHGAVDAVPVPDWMIRAVCKLRASGVGNVRAWRAIGRDPRCPQVLAGILQGKNIPGRLLRLTQSVRKRVTLIRSGGFIGIIE